jgi:hypothetical protein
VALRKPGQFGKFVVIDLKEFQEKAKHEHFWGETLIKWENGEPVLFEVHQKFKPKDFPNLVIVQVV